MTRLSTKHKRILARLHTIVFIPDIAQQALVLADHMRQESTLKLCDLAGLQFIKIPSYTGINHSHLLFNSHGSWRETKGCQWVVQINTMLSKSEKLTFPFINKFLPITYSHVLSEKLHPTSPSPQEIAIFLYLQVLTYNVRAFSTSTVYHLTAFKLFWL